MGNNSESRGNYIITNGQDGYGAFDTMEQAEVGKTTVLQLAIARWLHVVYQRYGLSRRAQEMEPGTFQDKMRDVNLHEEMAKGEIKRLDIALHQPNIAIVYQNPS